jgi:RNA polymerase sigma-70 factor, ECF subfamily
LKTAIPEILEQQEVETAQRDPAQFTVLYERHFERVFAFAARRLPTRQDAEDVTSDVFHQALAGLRGFRWQGTPFVGWLLGIAERMIAKRWQQIGRQPLAANAEMDFEDDAPDAERQAMFSQFVEHLSDDQRTVILRRFVEQQSVREIAASLGRSEGAVKQLQFRALENLRNLLRSRHE